MFVPVALNYDRVIEDRILTEANLRGDRRFRWTVPSAMIAVLRYIGRRMTGRARRMGTAAVSFGAPLSLRTEGIGLEAEELADLLMDRISAVMPVLPVPLVAAVLDHADGPIAEQDVAALARARLDACLQSGFPAFFDHGDGFDEAVNFALRRLRVRKILRDGRGGLEIAPGKERLVTFYAAMLPGNGSP